MSGSDVGSTGSMNILQQGEFCIIKVTFKHFSLRDADKFVIKRNQKFLERTFTEKKNFLYS